MKSSESQKSDLVVNKGAVMQQQKSVDQRKGVSKTVVGSGMNLSLGQDSEQQRDILDLNLSEIAPTPPNFSTLKQRPDDNSHEKSKPAAATNGEKVKQLKQFIYMVDLFNVMENESKQ
jgi:hypothetical protein